MRLARVRTSLIFFVQPRLTHPDGFFVNHDYLVAGEMTQIVQPGGGTFRGHKNAARTQHDEPVGELHAIPLLLL